MLLEQMIDIPLEIGSLFIYLSGIITGIILTCLIYVLLLILSINKSKKIIEAAKENITEEDVREMIKRSQENYLLLRKSSDQVVKDTAYKETCLNLINDIATKCFPNSKNPLLELSIDESLLLAKYIIQRIEELLNKRSLRWVKKISISYIFKILDTKKKIENNAVVKEVKKYSKFAKIGMSVASIVMKPFKLIGTGTKNYLITKIMLSTFTIVGEETYKIYTKQAIKSMDPEYMELLKSIEESEEEILEEVSK